MPGKPEQRVHDLLTPAIGACTQQLHDDGLAIAVRDDAGQAVRFGVNEPQRITHFVDAERVTGGGGILDPAGEEARIHFPRVPAPGTGPDLRVGAVRGEREHFAVARTHLHRVARAGRAFYALDGAGEDPRDAGV